MPKGSTQHKLAFKGATIMGNLARYHVENLPELMKVIRQNGIGMDDYLDRFFNITPTQTNYPPYNIVQVNNVETRLEVALAGFKKKDIKVYTEHGKLNVEGGKEDNTEKANYAHQGLAQRSFSRSWTISDDTEVKSVDFEDGLLTITVSKIVPEHYARKDWL